MKRCIIALLLGFDEVNIFKKNYSSEVAKVYQKICAPNQIQQALELTQDDASEWENVPYNHAYDYDLITVFHTDPKTLAPGMPEAKYEYCIAISLLEPLTDELNAHAPCFAAVRSILSKIENWDKDFKLIVRHHSLAGDHSISFDHKLMQQRFVPETHQKGFIKNHTYDVRISSNPKHTRRPITLLQAKTISREITTRTKDSIHLSILADWIANMLPIGCTFPAHHPLKITMGGCYAGKRFGTDNALIQELGHYLRLSFSKSFIQLIGSVSWTFYDDWRAVSFCDRYLEHESNDDPFRGVATKDEKKIFVKLPDSLRRYYTRMVTYNPNTEQFIYSARPAKNSATVGILHYAIERNKILLSNLIMQIFIRHNTSHTRVPQEILCIIEQIANNIFPTFECGQFLNGLHSSLALLNSPMYQSGPEEFLKFIDQTKSVIISFIFFVINERDEKKYTEIYNFIRRILDDKIKPIVYYKIQQNIQKKYIEMYKQLSTSLKQLRPMKFTFIDDTPNPFEEDTDSTSDEGQESNTENDGEEELEAFINVTEKALSERDRVKIARDHRYHFAPLLTFTKQLNQLLEEISHLRISSENPLSSIQEEINRIRPNLDQYWSTLR